MSKYTDILEILGKRANSNSKYFVEDKNYKFVPVKGFKNGLKKIDDMHLNILNRNISLVRTMKLREDDVFICGFPKSGINIIHYLR